MKVFISSLIGGFEAERVAVKSAITTFSLEPVMAEDFPAQPNSPQIACLQGVRKADVVILVLGEQYGAIQTTTGLSATHEEYREARQTKQILAFVQQGVVYDQSQADFVREVQEWEGGYFRGGFTNPTDLEHAVTKALHAIILANVVGPVDEGELRTLAAQMLSSSNGRSSTTWLELGLSFGPLQTILRPSEMEDISIRNDFLKEALFGVERIFDQSVANESGLVGNDLVLSQDGVARFRLCDNGAMSVSMVTERANRGSFNIGSVIIEEDIRSKLARLLGFASMVVDRIDATERLTHMAVAVKVMGGEYRTWRTEAQNAASPNSVSFGSGVKSEHQPITQLHKRAVLRVGRSQIVDDVTVLLRRQFPSG